MNSLISMIFASIASAALTGNQKITTHNYQEVSGALDTNPVFCGYPGSQLDITRITAVQGLTKDQCGACLKICNGEDSSKVQYVMAVDRGGVGLDLNTASFQALFNDNTGLYQATWEQVDSSHCAGILRNGDQYAVKQAPPTTVKPQVIATTTNAYAVQTTTTTTNPPVIPTTTTTAYAVQTTTTTSNPPVIPTTTTTYAVQTTTTTTNPPVVPTTTTTDAYPVNTTTTTSAQSTTTNAIPVITTTTDAYPIKSTTTTNAYPVITTTTDAYPAKSTTTTDAYPIKSTTTVTSPAYPTNVPKTKCHRRKAISN